MSSLESWTDLSSLGESDFTTSGEELFDFSNKNFEFMWLMTFHKRQKIK